MKTTNFTLSKGIGASPTIVNLRTLLQSIAYLAIFLFTFSTSINAQTCALSCHGANVSVDMDCSAMITTSMVADTSSCLSGSFIVTVMTTDNDTIETSPLVDFDQLGETLKVSVLDEVSGNSCWSFITIEDKMPPMIQCADATIECVDLETIALPIATDNCTVGNVQLVDEDIDNLNDPCDLVFIKKVTQSFVATDLAGNKSDTCTQTLMLKRIDFSNIVWPDSFVIVNDNAISCTAPFPDANNDGNPDPLPVSAGGTDVPRINGVAIYPDFNFACNSATTFVDINLGQLACVRKIMRAWTVREWHCSGERDTTYFQLIEIVDENGPTIACPPDVNLTTNFQNCNANYAFPVLPVSDSCSAIERVTVSYPGGFMNANGGFNANLPVGENVITYTAYDECLNSTECSYSVNVNDNTPPIPVCDEHTIVSLTGYEIGGLTIIPASVFDDGSYDECGDVTFRVQRMTSCIDFDWTTSGVGVDTNPNGLVNSPDLGIVSRSGIPVACCDVGAGAFMVALIVTDESGNSNTCMVEVEVQDKLPPVIECPTNVTISCEFDYDLTDLSAFGEVVLTQAERDEFCLFDPTNPNADVNDFICGVDGLALDNCSLTLTENILPNINNCGIGTIRRTFIARDANGAASCAQFITVENFDPFTRQDIVFPLDFLGAECGLGTDPDDLQPPYNRPVITEDECDLVGINYEDQLFPFVDGACFKILRTWRVIEWCLYEELGGIVEGENYWEYTQVIKVQNAFGPEFQTEQPDIEVCNTVDCGGLFVELIQTANDDCTPDAKLRWSYTIDFFNDNSINVSRSGNGPSIDASDVYALGTHKIVYSFEDLCGNKTSREQTFTVNSCKAPTPVCLSLAADLMPIDVDNDGTNDAGMVVIWAKEFDASSEHLCGLAITFSFSENPGDSSRTFTCDDLGLTPVRMYVHDSNGRFAYCETTIDIQDNMEVCDGSMGNLVTIGGDVNTENTLDVAEVEISLAGSNLLPVVTSTAGNYSFPSMPTGGSYEIVPARDGDDKNGVSTLDLVRIQKHLLGLEPLASPYLMIAADANNSESVSALDLVELRKLILGVYTELPSNTSWRFVDQSYTFPDPFNPWMEVYPESYTLNSVSQSMNNADFVAIKIGDLNNTVVANATQVVTRGANDLLTFAVADQTVSAGNSVKVDVFADQFEDMQAFQFTLNIENSNLQLVDIESGALEISNENFGLNRMEDGQITMGWYDVNTHSVSQDEVLFTLTFKAAKQVVLSKTLSLTSEVTTAEAYNDNNETMDVALTFRGAQEDAAFELMQNIPNPFNTNTKIAFKLPSAMNAMLTVYDVTGRQLVQLNLEGVKGYNEVTLDRGQISATGILYYRLSTEGYTASRKMVVTK